MTQKTATTPKATTNRETPSHPHPDHPHPKHLSKRLTKKKQQRRGEWTATPRQPKPRRAPRRRNSASTPANGARHPAPMSAFLLPLGAILGLALVIRASHR